MKYVPFLILLFTLPLHAATYYVDAVNGNDANNGSSVEEAWKNIERAYDSNTADPNVEPGDTVKMRTGDYGTFTETTGSRASYITYIADTGQLPVFSGIPAMNLVQSGGPLDKYLRFEGITIQDANAIQDLYLISLDDANYVKFIDCNIVGAGYNFDNDAGRSLSMEHSENIEIDGCKIYGDGTGTEPNMGFPFGIYSRNCNNITITDCEIQECATAILAWGSDWTVGRNTIFDIQNDAFKGASIRECVFEDNLVYDIRRPPGTSAHNDCFQLFYVGGINPGETDYVAMDNVICRRNIMYNSGGQIVNAAFAVPKDMNGLVFENNVMWGAGLDALGSWEVRLRGDLEVNFINNTIIGKIFFEGTIIVGDIQNNLMRRCQLPNPGPQVLNENFNTVDTWWNPGYGPAEMGANSIELDHYFNEDNGLFYGEFTDYDANDFTLATDSNAINTGNIAYSPTTDVLGVPRDGSPDRGAYEDTDLVVESGPPEPNPATWVTVPEPNGDNTISMVATTATSGPSPRSYFFREITGNPGATSSGWQVSDATYTDTGLDGNTTYTYQVQIRDTDACTGTWSDANSATATDTTAPTPDAATFAIAPAAVSGSSITMTATTGTDGGATVEYYFAETTGKDGGTDSGWQSSATYTDTGLSNSTEYTYTVQMRDGVPNTGAASSGSSATTLGSTTPGNLRDRWFSGYRSTYRSRYKSK